MIGLTVESEDRFEVLFVGLVHKLLVRSFTVPRVKRVESEHGEAFFRY